MNYFYLLDFEIKSRLYATAPKANSVRIKSNVYKK